jgi:hypothetical protein
MGDMDRDGERDEDRAGMQKRTETLPRGIRPRGTTFESEYLCEFETKFENNLGYDSGFHMEQIHEKN